MGTRHARCGRCRRRPSRTASPSVRFKYLKYALALVLVFIGSKIFLVGIIGKIPAVISLSVIFGLIAGGVLVSLWKTRGQSPVGEPT